MHQAQSSNGGGTAAAGTENEQITLINNHPVGHATESSRNIAIHTGTGIKSIERRDSMSSVDGRMLAALKDEKQEEELDIFKVVEKEE